MGAVLLLLGGFVLALQIPVSNKTISGEVQVISLTESTYGSSPVATIHDPGYGAVVVHFPPGLSLKVGDRIMVDRGKTIFGSPIHRFIGKELSYNTALQSTASSGD